MAGIAILGWGSLLWDRRSDFDEQIQDWQFDGPELKLEFSRISEKSRSGALTLVIDEHNGAPCKVAYAISKRHSLEDVIGDLRCREGTIHGRIGYWTSRGLTGKPAAPATIEIWLMEQHLDAAVWTGLESNYREKTREDFTVERALTYLANLTAEGKAKAAEYIWQAPDFVRTALRDAVQVEPWFTREQG